jgi:hypothetical protein
MRGWPAVFVPKVWLGLREWNKDGPVPAPASLGTAPLGLVYEWHGLRLVCVNCPDAVR